MKEARDKWLHVKVGESLTRFVSKDDLQVGGLYEINLSHKRNKTNGLPKEAVVQAPPRQC